jgi:carboxypeptidase Q
MCARGRFEGAVRAAAYGAVATLLRSVAPFSLATPHTGSMDPAPIPAAAITHEDADMLARLAARARAARARNAAAASPDMHVRVDPPVVRLVMEAALRADAPSRNIIAEWWGRDHGRRVAGRAEEVVVIGGHIDSWDVGGGALDDGGGAFAAWEAIRLMAKYQLRPQRTVRVVFWTVRAALPA